MRSADELRNIETATHIEVDADVRYWEDARINGIVDADGDLIFGRDRSKAGNLWRVRINLAEGRIEGWPADMQAEIHYKVCEDRTSTRLNSSHYCAARMPYSACKKKQKRTQIIDIQTQL